MKILSSIEMISIIWGVWLIVSIINRWHDTKLQTIQSVVNKGRRCLSDQEYDSAKKAHTAWHKIDFIMMALLGVLIGFVAFPFIWIQWGMCVVGCGFIFTCSDISYNIMIGNKWNHVGTGTWDKLVPMWVRITGLVIVMAVSYIWVY